MARKKDQRRKSVVDARVQWTLALRVVVHFLVFISASFCIGLILQYLTNPLGGISEHLRNFWSQSAPMLVALLCLIPVFVRDTLTLSNRIAGPICRLRDTVRRIGAGEDVPPLAFRKNDMWDDLPQLFNVMVARLKDEESAAANGRDEVVSRSFPAELLDAAPEPVEL